MFSTRVATGVFSFSVYKDTGLFFITLGVMGTAILQVPGSPESVFSFRRVHLGIAFHRECHNAALADGPNHISISVDVFFCICRSMM